MTHLIADSGSTKTTWLFTDNSGKESFFTSQGINPFHMTEDVIRGILRNEVLPLLQGMDIDGIEFYGAGCTKEKCPVMERLLREVLCASDKNGCAITVGSDMLGAAKALFGDNPGIACILGTGANSCLYDGREIVENISPMGYILGDEGSGAVLGKTFLNVLYKGKHRDFIPVFEAETGLTLPDIINKVYRPSDGTPANRFLASLCPFIKKHLDVVWIEELVTKCFRQFFQNNTKHYTNSNDLPIGFVGSIAYYFEEQLRQAAEKENSSITTVMKEPLVSK